MGIIMLACGLDVVADTHIEDMAVDGDPEGHVNAFFELYTAVITLVIVFSSLFGCFTSYMKNQFYFNVLFQLVAIISMIFLFIFGSGFLAL